MIGAIQSFKKSEYAFQLQSEAELLETFRLRDRKKVVLPKFLHLPLSVQYYFAWTEPTGLYVYLIFKKAEWEAPKGIVFRRDDKGSSISSARLCEWCHSYGPSDQIGMLSVKLTPRNIVGILLCLNLECLERLETSLNFSKKHFDRLALDVCERIARFYDRRIVTLKETQLS